MLRIALACFLAASCAHAPAPVPQNLSPMGFMFSFELPEVPKECPEVIQLDGEIDGSFLLVETLKVCADRAVLIEINSPGGSIFSALDIQKAIERHPHPVYCVVDGMAASAAFVTLQSCDVRMMTKRSVLMAHHASVAQTGGQSHELQNMADALRAIDRANTLQMAERLGMTPEAFEAKVHDGHEWWMALDEALAANAIDFDVASVSQALELISYLDGCDAGTSAPVDGGSP